MRFITDDGQGPAVTITLLTNDDKSVLIRANGYNLIELRGGRFRRYASTRTTRIPGIEIDSDGRILETET